MGMVELFQTVRKNFLWQFWNYQIIVTASAFRAGNFGTFGDQSSSGYQNSYPPVQWTSIKIEQKKEPIELLIFFPFS